MKKIFLALVLALSVVGILSAAVPRTYRVEDIPNVQKADSRRFVSNPDGLLSRETVYRMDTMLYALKESGRAQVAVVAVNSIGNDEPFDFLQRLVMSWGVGRGDTDDGLGVLLVIDQGAIEIQTGYGLEGDLPDALLKRIINNLMLPYFRNGDWDGGMLAGMTAICDVLQGRPADYIGADRYGETGNRIPFIFLLPFLLVGGYILWKLIVVALGLDRLCPKCHHRTLQKGDTIQLYKDSDTVMTETTYVCSRCGHVVRKRNSRSRNGGHSGGGMIIGGMGGGMFGSGGGSFGGGGGFGGGSFGGGGASGRF